MLETNAFITLETNAFIVLETNAFRAGDERVENTRLNLSHTHIASYQRLPNRAYVEIIATHLRKRAISRSLTHLRERYEIAFSVGRNGLQVDQVNKENDKLTSNSTQLLPSTRSLVRMWPDYTRHAHTIIA